MVLADAESHADLGRVVNAIELAKECTQQGDDVAIIFDGAGTRWVPVLDDPSHRRHAAWLAVKEKVAGACAFCSAAFGVKEGVDQAGVKLLDEFENHPSLRGYIAGGYQVVTF